jgi:hypothetical protein
MSPVKIYKFLPIIILVADSLISKEGGISMKKLVYLIVSSILLLGLAFPACAADSNSGGSGYSGDEDNNSITIAWQYLAGGFAYADYERSIGEHSALNITGMHLYDGVYKFFFKTLFLGVETDFTAVDLSYKYYLGRAQNGLYCGADVMFVDIELSTENSSSQSNFTLYGGGLGLRNITRIGLTYDIGVIALYNRDNEKTAGFIRANLGWAW